jgi:hypothetical protein
LGDSSDGTFLGAQTDLEELLVPGVDLLEPGATRLPDFGIFHDFGRSKTPAIVSPMRLTFQSVP